MTIQLVLAPAAHGKTAYVIDEIRALPPLSPVRVLVPGKIELTAFRRRLAASGGALGVEVQTFYGLYAEVLTLAGSSGDPPGAKLAWSMARLLPPVRHRLIQHIVGALCEGGQLSYYAPLRNSSGFARLLADLLGELKRARVFLKEFESATAGREPRLAELARIYAAYQAWLVNTGWVDAEGQGWLAAIALEENPTLLSSLSLLVVDGFDEFNPTQLRLLRLLAERAAATLVTLTGDASAALSAGPGTSPDRPHRLAHHRPARALAAFKNAMAATDPPIEIVTPSPPHPLTVSGAAPPCHPVSPSLSHLEASLFGPSPPRCKADGAIEFVEAQNRAAEAREALRWLKARIVRDGLSLSEVAVVARDETPYRPFLEEIGLEFGMPLRFVSGLELRANPAIAALLNLLALTLEPDSWSPRALLDALGSPYFDWRGLGLQLGDAGRLEDVAREGQVVSGLEQWREAFQRAAARASEEDQEAESPVALDEEDFAPRHPPSGPEVARLAAVLEKIVARVTPLSEGTLRERVAWVEALIGEDPALLPGATGVRLESPATTSDDDASLRVVARARENPATAGRDVAALRAFKDILRGLVLADSVLTAPMLGPASDRALRPGTYDEFIAELTQAVEGTTYTTPVEGEAILVASALEVRGLAFDSVALLGLAEGEFPRAEREDALLRESDRAWLKERGFAIEPRLQGDEATLFYQAVTRPRRRLLLCRPYLADDGQAWEPSPYWSTVQDLFEDALPRRVRSTDPVTDVASEQELVSATGGEATQMAAAILEARSRSDPSPWQGNLSALTAQLAERFGPDQPWSSSRLETYAKCPFYFWAAYAMELEPRELPRPGYDVLILGSIYHLVLEWLYRRVPDGDPDRLRAELPAVAQEVYDSAPNDYGFRPTPLWERQQEELTGVLSRTLEALIEIAGDYVPLAQELAFGLKGVPTLVVQDGPMHAPLRLRGYIDRVDRAPDGRLRVIDYKAGSTPISKRELDDGHRLQLPLYALAAQQALGAEVASAFYWHVSSAKPSTLQLEKYQGGVPGAIETAIEYALPIATAVRQGQLSPRPPDEGCPTFCPAAAFCEKYKPKSW